jgi:hypothetical protein
MATPTTPTMRSPIMSARARGTVMVVVLLKAYSVLPLERSIRQG